MNKISWTPVEFRRHLTKMHAHAWVSECHTANSSTIKSWMVNGNVVYHLSHMPWRVWNWYKSQLHTDHGPGEDPCQEWNGSTYAWFLGKWQVATAHSESIHSKTTERAVCLLTCSNTWCSQSVCSSTACCLCQQQSSSPLYNQLSPTPHQTCPHLPAEIFLWPVLCTTTANLNVTLSIMFSFTSIKCNHGVLMQK